jgi:hypothetical protein
MSIRSRIRDYLLERRIHKLCRQHVEATRRNAPLSVRRELWIEYTQAVAERSPEAVRRLERVRGLVGRVGE